MIPGFKLSPTFVGTFAVFVWGLSLPLTRLIAGQIGVVAVMGTVFAATGVLGLLNRRRLRQGFAERAVFANPLFYARWLLFALNPLCIWTASFIVEKPHLPLVVLINYLWPTLIILFSVLIAGVRITRPPFFIAGTLIVLAALSIEILRPDTLGTSLFAARLDRVAYLLALGSALAWSLYTSLTRRAGSQTGGPAVIPLFQLSLGLLLPVSFVPAFHQWSHVTFILALVIAGWSVLQFLAMLSWDYGTRNGNIVLLSLCADFIPWLALAVSHVLLGVDIGSKTILSAICLVAGAMITRYGTLQKRGEAAQLQELAQEHSPAD